MSVDDTQLANTLDSATRARAAVVADGDTLASGDAIAMDGDTLASGHAIAVDTDTLGSGSATGGVSNPRGEPGALPQRLGRYHVLGRLGSGGMGIVFSAYDPDLDRRVALKLLRTDNGGHDSQLRLLREAQALARLSHPNVVQIYDTGALGEQVFIAMEFIRGDDLHTWLGSASRGIDEILRVFLDAGRGLAAAHDAGLVHRDFKPDNVLVGADGRICVADFGLARNHGDEAATQTNAASARPLDMSLTATGAVLGTPTYMSPEQHEGRIADARSDQFSFCVALWEALHGRRPFRGETHSELAIAVTLGTIQDPPADTRAPRRLTEILRRGLLVDPTRRYPSMQALLAALAPTPTRSRGRWLAAAALVSLTGGAGLAFASWRASEAGACSSGADEIATVWADSDRAAVTDALAGDSGAAARIVAGLDTYATGWTEAHRDACLVHHRGEQSSTLLDARMRCLQQRRGALASAVRLLSGRSDSPFDAAQVVARLPALAPCSDVGFVMAEVAIPEDPVLATAVAAAEERVTEARTRFHGGDLSGAERIAEAAVAEARRLEFKPLLAEALLALGTIEMSGPKASEATGHLEEATAVAVATHHDAVAAETFARRIFVEAMANSTPTDVLLAQVPLARAFAQRLPEPASALARASSNEGTVHLARADRTRAAEAFARAVAESDHAIDVDPIERSNYLQYLAYATDDPQQRDSLFARSEAGLLAVLGLDHPLVLQRRLVRAWLMSDLKTSGALLATTCQALRERSPDDTSACAQCNSTLGAIEARLEHTAEARTALAATRICVEGRTTDPGLQLLAKNAAALEALLAGAHADAIAAADTGIAEFAVHRDEPWMAAELAKLELTRGRALVALDRRAEAIAALERAVAGLAAPHPEDQYTLPKLALTDARALLATPRGEP